MTTSCVPFFDFNFKNIVTFTGINSRRGLRELVYNYLNLDPES